MTVGPMIAAMLIVFSASMGFWVAVGLLARRREKPDVPTVEFGQPFRYYWQGEIGEYVVDNVKVSRDSNGSKLVVEGVDRLSYARDRMIMPPYHPADAAAMKRWYGVFGFRPSRGPRSS